MGVRITAGCDDLGAVMASLPAFVGRELSVDIVEDGKEGTASTAQLLSALVHALPWWPQEAAELGIAFEDTYLTVRALQGRLVVRTRFPAVRSGRAPAPLDPIQLGWRWSGQTHIQLLGSTRTETELSQFSHVLDLTVHRVLGEDRLTGFMYGAPEATAA